MTFDSNSNPNDLVKGMVLSWGKGLRHPTIYSVLDICGEQVELFNCRTKLQIKVMMSTVDSAIKNGWITIEGRT